MFKPGSVTSRRILRYGIQGAILSLVASSFIFFYNYTRDHEGTWGAILRFDVRFLPVLAGMVGIAWICAALRTLVLARALGHSIRFGRALIILLSTEFALGSTPGGVGGAITRFSLQKQSGIPMTTSTTMLAADIAADLLYFLLLLPFGIAYMVRFHLWERISHLMHGQVLLTVLGVIVAALAIVLFFTNGPGKRVMAWLLHRHDWGRRRRMRARFRALLWNAGRGWRRIKSVTWFLLTQRRSAFLASFLLAAVQISCRYGVMPMVLLAFGHEVNPLTLILFQGIIFALSLLVLLPGGGGSVELATSVILPLVAPRAIPGPVVVIWRFFTYHLYLLVGGLVFYRQVRGMDQTLEEGRTEAERVVSIPPPPPSTASGIEQLARDAAATAP